MNYRPKPKAGVHFLETPSGAVLMDLHGDRFVALSGLSATIWSGLTSCLHRDGVIDLIAATRGVDKQTGERILVAQLECWRKAHLIDVNDTAPNPVAKPSRLPPHRELSDAELVAAPIIPRTVLSLVAAHRRYRRALEPNGMIRALLLLERESGSATRDAGITLRRTVRSYHLLRRLFTQGRTSRDCLVRSLALAAVLRRSGIPADLCVGIFALPFHSHAWVEHDGVVLSESLATVKTYSVIGRF